MKRHEWGYKSIKTDYFFQEERNEGKQALISQVSELTNKFSSVGLEKGSSEPSPTTTPGGVKTRRIYRGQGRGQPK